MGHQTNYRQCKKCKNLIITTIVFGKRVVTSNCICNKTNNQKG